MNTYLTGINQRNVAAPIAPAVFQQRAEVGQAATLLFQHGGGTRSMKLGSAAQHPLVATAFCIYTLSMKFTWSERKRSLNLKQHGLDFVDAPTVFAGLTFTFEDDRFSYQEQRFVTLGLLAGIPVSVVHTETTHEIRIISFRKATQREARIYFSQVQD